MNVDLIFKLLHIAEAALKFPNLAPLHQKAMFLLQEEAAPKAPADIHGVGVAPAPGAFVRRAIPDTEKGDD